MPAGGAFPKWGHGHGCIMSELPTARNFWTRPFNLQSNRWTSNPPIHVFPPQKVNQYVQEQVPIDIISLYANPQPRTQYLWQFPHPNPSACRMCWSRTPHANLSVPSNFPGGGGDLHPILTAKSHPQ